MTECKAQPMAADLELWCRRVLGQDSRDMPCEDSRLICAHNESRVLLS
jgi:hypothetical protein